MVSVWFGIKELVMLDFPENEVHDPIGLPIAFIEQDHGYIRFEVHGKVSIYRLPLRSFSLLGRKIQAEVTRLDPQILSRLSATDQ
jgi:hypothetical protein